MLTIASKVDVSYEKSGSVHKLKFKNLNYNIMGYIAAGVNFLAKLAQGADDTKASKKQK
jgi:hypothetical protein